jgi:hypothetical protein
MSRRIVVALVLAVGFVAGDPYFSSAIARVTGEHTTTGIDHDNTTSTLVSGPGVGPFEWLPVMPGALVVQGSRRAGYESKPSRSGKLELLSHDDADPIVAWYAAQLAFRGFDVETARAPDPLEGFLAVDSRVVASSARRGLDVRVLVRSREALLLRPRLVEIVWFDRSATASAAAPR